MRRVAERAAPLALAIAASLLPLAARPGELVPAAGAERRLEAIPVEERIAFLWSRLDAERPAARSWSIAWGIAYGALTTGQLAAIPFTSDRSSRVLLAAGAATSTLGVLQILLLPITPDRLAEGSTPGPAHGRLTLAEAEQALERSARNEAPGSGTLAQLSNLAINAAFGVAVGLVNRNWSSGALSAGGGWALGEAAILTEPRGLIADLARYRSGELDRPRPPAPALCIAPLPGCSGVSIAFAL
jgi:hypothetical protein